MKRRWLIRSVFIAILTLCIGAWAVSYFHYVCVEYFGRSKTCFLGGEYGWLYFGTFTTARISPSPWDLSYLLASGVRAREQYLSTDGHWAGFAWKGGGGPRDFTAWLPLYFPTLLSALLLWFAWRKTKTKTTGFPVEPTVSVEGK